MNRTLGYTLVACALAASAYTGSSWWLGQQIETHYNDKMDTWAQEYAPDVEIVDRHYDRGVFSSRATLVLQLPLPLPAQAPEDEEPCDDICEELPDEDAQTSPMRPASLTLARTDAPASHGPADRPAVRDEGEAGERKLRLHVVNDIRHGPWAGGQLALTVIDSRIVHVDGVHLSDKGRQALGGIKSPTAHLVVGLDREARGKVQLPAGEIIDPDNTANHLRWQVLDYDFTIPASQQRLIGTATWPSVSGSVELAKDDGHMRVRLALSNLRSRFDSELPDGQSLTVAGQYVDQAERLHVQFTKARGTPWVNLLDLKDIHSDTRITRPDTTQDNGQPETMLNIEHRLDSQGMLGTVQMDKLAVHTELQKLDEAALMSLLETFNAQDPAEAPDTDSPAFQAPFRQLLAAQPQLRTRLNITVGKETGSLDYALTLAEPGPTPETGTLMQAVKQKMSADLSLRLPIRWAELVEQAIDLPAGGIHELARFGAAQGLLREDDGHWTTDTRLHDGKVIVNGRQIGSL
ncbi:MAG: DUF945 family protein [Lautropia sp.]|nr:DUF945 family protein [Lautropia sp.]